MPVVGSGSGGESDEVRVYNSSGEDGRSLAHQVVSVGP